VQESATKLVERTVLGGTEAFTGEGLLVTEVIVPNDIRFADIRRLLESHGWSLVRIRGSHHIFSKPGAGSTSVPVHGGKVKHAYYRKIKKLLGEAE
jgi:predicted RNA binding protein YcfA (HicA-like mRNA interferase family)